MNLPVMHTYEVGMGSDKRRIEAPSAGAAAMYYGIQCVNTNNPFMAAVYTEDGETYEGDAFWMNLLPDEAHVEAVFKRVPIEDVKACRVVGDEAQP